MPKENIQTHDILPCDDIMFSIFICLSIKSLLRFQSISKSSKAMICDRNFKKKYCDCSKAVGRQKLLLRQEYSNDFVFRDPELITMDDHNQFFPPKQFQYSEISCSYDGLFLLKNPKAYKTYLLLNPSAREYRILECPYVKYKDDLPNAYYKVILIFKFFYVVYSLSTHSWTIKTSPPHLVQPYYISRRYCAKGISTQDGTFWSMNNIIGKCVDTTSSIMHFDMTLDEVKKISVPNLDFIGVDDVFRLITIKDCLSLYGGKRRNRELQVWIMEQDGWKWLLNICNLPANCHVFVSQTELLHLTKNGEVLLLGCMNLVSIYYPKRQQFVTVLQERFSLASVCLDTLYFFKPTLKRKRKQPIIQEHIA
ncbi:hypothetical protein R3W88_014794 [Solanum pinnatisectum]|uniref:F-box domain-containing protein n=1 Tax=Solanum pinnatisectum TaxID=50273 RepID=A0AAV9KSM3_9SOLN|nr:hypothetical protein R3W88_014794 [Solanum pinnatisectum]